MGGCASKPKEYDVIETREAPVTPNSIAGPDIKAEDRFKACYYDREIKGDEEDGGEMQNEKPSIEISEPKRETVKAPCTAPEVVVIKPVSDNVTAKEKLENKVGKPADTTATPVVMKEEVKEKETEAKVEEKTAAPVVTKEKEAVVEGKNEKSLVNQP